MQLHIKPETTSMKYLAIAILWSVITTVCVAATKTWDGRYDTEGIEVTVVYFVPKDRHPLVDWRERVDYYCKRIEQFHAREFAGQSELRTIVHPEPIVSHRTTAQLRVGDGDAIYYRTLEETDRRLNFASGDRTAFPILLVLSEINWRPLDDFYRLRPDGDTLVFEGNYNNGQHFPGAASGGARASYRVDRGVGWGLVSADGWRVPYRGSDCVVYHEGCGHTVGLPHPPGGNGSVMSLGQYRGWISESWVDKEQKTRLGWEPSEVPHDPQRELFSTFRALPQPSVPQPGAKVALELDWPEDAKVKSLRVRLQTSLDGPWLECPQQWSGDAPRTASLISFDRPTPVSYRVDAQLENNSRAELWGYFQVREAPDTPPQPRSLMADLVTSQQSGLDDSSLDGSSPHWPIDLLETDPAHCWSVGDWRRVDGKLESPKQYGARIELPYSPPPEYRLAMIVEPIDDPNGLILGQRLGESRFVTLFNYASGESISSALENVDGRNVGNETTFQGRLFEKNRLSQLTVTVLKDRVTMSVDGRAIVDWKGGSDQLSLSDYWMTPNDTALFLGAYDCRYRFHRITLNPISGEGRALER